MAFSLNDKKDEVYICTVLYLLTKFCYFNDLSSCVFTPIAMANAVFFGALTVFSISSVN